MYDPTQILCKYALHFGEKMHCYLDKNNGQISNDFFKTNNESIRCFHLFIRKPALGGHRLTLSLF